MLACRVNPIVSVLAIVLVCAPTSLLTQHAALQGNGTCRARTFTAPPPEYSPMVQRARHVICSELAGRAPGVQIAVAVDGSLLWSEGYGYADVEHERPVTATTMFRIGSISKPFTAEAVALLVQRGQLDLDIPVQQYAPAFPVKQWSLTTRQLAGHLGGIRGYIDDYAENHSNRSYPTVTSGLSIFSNDSLLFEPGTQFSYSTYGYSLLSAVIEGASGQSFPAFMQANVFSPLGLLHTAMDRPDSVIPDRAQTYEPDASGAFHVAPPVDNSYKWAGGGMLSTAEDLVSFGSVHLRPGHLTPSSLDLLFTSMRTRDGRETGYGVGWYIGADEWGHHVASHAGSAIGGSTFLVVDQDRNVVLAMCLNLSGTDAVGNLLSPVWSELPRLFDLEPAAAPLLDAFNADDVPRILSAYQALGDTATGLASLVEAHVNGLGYKRLAAGDVQGAVDVFTLNTQNFPNAFNTWDSLAEAYLARADTATAIKYYQKSLELNPRNENAREILTRLGRRP